MHFLTSALDGGEWSVARADHFTPRERDPVTHWIGGWVGPRSGLDMVSKRKIPSPRGESNPDHPITQHMRMVRKLFQFVALGLCEFG
jgi:hypothetical protein